MSLTEDEKIRAARAAYMRDYAKKRRRSSQEARSREKEYRDRYWLRKFQEMQAASGGGKDGWNGKTE
ncbi:hypothetical protein [Hominenteromicrobium sp.]|jgi:hypothetical protein|uniref:hypothetical protein n=1 Tax=Hominenteromicrobium sp. TaxID=3073581 RepID=UPI003AB60BCE